MGVNNLWKALVKGNAVQTFEGSKPGQHAEIVKEVENKVVAVDLSAWLMQAQTQPAMLEHYDSAYARAVKVVFDRTIHWLRYGCLPVFVIEGQTPAAKLDKLRQRCIAQYGPTSRPYSVGNRAGGQFDKLGQAVKRLLDAFGIPCVQAVGEGEALCAALNLCGWVHACHTLDVDALLFGALTVYRQMHLQTDDPRRSVLTKCCRSDVQRVLGISRGGDAALMAVAQLAGGDYDTVGAEQVGEALALEAVRCLLRGHEDDEDVLQELDAAITAGPDPELDALKGCTGCKACGHEGGRKSRIAQHTARGGACAACRCSSGCTPRQWEQCECEFHRRADDRLLNRVVSRALKTPGFVNNCRIAAATYADQLQQAIAAVQQEYGLPVSGSSANVFTWRHRPDVRAISEIMCRYIKEWDHNQVRLKLLPLLLEWDVRQGPSAGPAAGVQFRPTGIRKVSGKANEDITGVPVREQQGWRYVLLVERLQQHKPSQLGAAAGISSGAAAAAAAAPADDWEAEDLAIDLAWIANKARSKPPKPAAAGGGDGAAGGSAAGGAEELAGDDELDDLQLGSQSCYHPQSQATQGFSCSQQPMSQGPLSQASASQAASGGRSSGSLQFSEHRSLRCSLMEAVWPELVAAFRNPPAASGRARSGGRKKAAAGAAAAAAAGGTDKQRSVKDFFGTVKDYTAAKPASKPGARQPAGNDDIIPGLAGIASSSRQAAAAAHAAMADARDMQLSSGFSPAAAVVAAAAAAEATGGPDIGHSSTKRPPQGSFMDWIESLQQDEQEQAPQQPQLHDAWGYGAAAPEASNSSQAAAAAAPVADNGAHRVFVGVKSSQGVSSPARRTASAGARTPGRSAGGRARGRGSSKQQVMPAGAMDSFLQPAAPPPPAQLAAAQPASPDSTQPQPPQQHKQQILPDVIDCCDSPEVLPLAARLANRAAAGPTGRSIPAAAELLPAQAGAAGAAASTAAEGAMAPPAKRASTDRAREALSSPEKTGAASSTAAAAADAAGCSSPHEKDQQQSRQQPTAAAAAAGVQPRAITQQYQALVDAIAGPSPVASSQVHPNAPGSSTARELFNTEHRTVRQQQRQQLGTPDVIELLDSPASNSRRNVEVVDLT